MRALTVIQTISRIKADIQTTTQEIFLSYDYIQTRRQSSGRFERSDSRAVDAGPPLEIVIALQDLSRFSERSGNDRDIRQVLIAFDLGMLLDPEWLTIRSAMLMGPTEDIDMEEIGKLVTAWNTMTRSRRPWVNLVDPGELSGPEYPEDHVALEIRGAADRDHSLSSLSEVASSFQELYDSIGKVYGLESSKLEIVKIESGSMVRIDLRGSGEPIKQLKEFILEAWHKIRHKRVEEVIESNNALMSSLAVAEEIKLRVDDQTLSAEEGEALKRSVVRNSLTLFEHGAVIAEIPDVELVDNTKLLEGFVPKALPPGREVEEAERSDSEDEAENPEETP